MRKELLIVTLACTCLAPAWAAEPTTGPLAGTTAAHNQVRQNLNNGAPPVTGAAVQPVPVPALGNFTWDDALAAGAQSWADNCVFDHDSGPFGENIASGFATVPAATLGWAGEVTSPGYNYNEGGANHDCNGGPIIPAGGGPSCGHYTAIVWQGTTKIGCGWAACGGSPLTVCRYQPAGNIAVETNRPYCTAAQTTGCQQLPVTITVNKTGTGTGLVESNWQGPGGMGLIHCGATCTWSFQPGSLANIQLTATPDPGSTFTGWAGDCAHAGMSTTCDLGTVTTDKNVTAGFSAGPPQRTLTVTKGGTGTGTVTSAPGSINCGATCSDTFSDGTMVTLTAAASGTSTFSGWGGDCAASGANTMCSLTMNANKDVTATFNDPCANPQQLACDTAYNGNTTGATNDFQGYPADPTCTNGSGDTQVGNDVLHQLTPQESGAVTVDLTFPAGGADLDLFALGTCAASSCIITSEQAGAVDEQVVFTAVGGQSYYVVVEDFPPSVGSAYTLTATCPCSAPDGRNLTATDSTVNGAETLHVCSNLTIDGTSIVTGTGHWTLWAGNSVAFEDGLEVQMGGELTVGNLP